MSVEAWDHEEAERLWRDAQAVMTELTLSVEEVGERFAAESFAATVTGDGHRLAALADEARGAAGRGRHVAYLLDLFAEGIERREMPLVRAAAYYLRQTAEIEFRWTSGGVQGVG